MYKAFSFFIMNCWDPNLSKNDVTVARRGTTNLNGLVLVAQSLLGAQKCSESTSSLDSLKTGDGRVASDRKDGHQARQDVKAIIPGTTYKNEIIFQRKTRQLTICQASGARPHLGFMFIPMLSRFDDLPFDLTQDNSKGLNAVFTRWMGLI